jgi:hypothetical protein
MLRRYLRTDVSNRIFRNNFGAILHSWLKSVVANPPGYSRGKGSEIHEEIPGENPPRNSFGTEAGMRRGAIPPRLTRDLPGTGE